jgi:MFS family permease
VRPAYFFAMLLVFTHPGFRRLWLNSVFSDAGTVILIMSQGLLALEVTDSAFWSASMAGSSGIGIMAFSLVAGVMADRIDRRILVGLAAVMDLAVAAVVASLLFFGAEALWQLLLVSFVNGVSISIRAPARNTLTLDLVGREQLLKATAANFAALQFVTIFAPLAAGLTITAYGFAWAYVIVAVVASLALVSLFGLRGVPPPSAKGGAPVREFMEGVRYVFTAPTVRTLMLLAIVAEVFVWSHESILPVMAERALNVGPSGMGYLLSAAGAGALVTTIVISSIRQVGRKGIVALVGLGMFGTFLMLFALSPWFPLSLILITVAYSGAMAYETMLSALLQTVVPNKMRGRVLSFQTATWGLTGVSGFHMGAMATAVGAPITIAIGGAVVLVVVVGGALLVNVFKVAPWLWRVDERAADQSDDD